jgi:hypothetical protein
MTNRASLKGTQATFLFDNRLIVVEHLLQPVLILHNIGYLLVTYCTYIHTLYTLSTFDRHFLSHS